MKALNTEGIILNRINYGEADRILVILTPDNGKIKVMAKGVRKIKSKLAGGVELFSISEISYISGRKDIGTLISSRLKIHYGKIIKDINRVNLGYELIRLLNKMTEEDSELSHFNLLQQAFISLNDLSINPLIINSWFKAQILVHAGHRPNLSIDINGHKLSQSKNYNFIIEDMALSLNPQGLLQQQHIKLLRLFFEPIQPAFLNRIEDTDNLLIDISPIINSIFNYHIY